MPPPRRLVAEHAATLPRDIDALVALPGIGRSTAGAILAAGHGIRAPILDGNVKRVLARCFAVPGYPGQTSVANTLWRHAEANTPAIRVADYTQAIMDLGATRVYARQTPLRRVSACRRNASPIETDTIDRYPGPRPRKTLPVRRVRMFVLTDADGRCLLERRPPSGIWGGLWSPPERDARLSTSTHYSPKLACDRRACRELHARVFRHTFTHFHMDIEPVRIDVRAPAHRVTDPDRWRWYGAGDNEPLGLSSGGR